MKHFRSLFDSLTLSILMGCYLTVFVPSLYFWPGNFYRQYYSESLASVILALLVMGGTKLLLNNFAKMPNVRQETYIIPVTIFWLAIGSGVLWLFNIPFNIKFCALSAVLSAAYITLVVKIKQKYRPKKYAYIPIGRAVDLPEQVPDVDWVRLDSPAISEPYKAIAADLHHLELSAQWQAFIAEMTLQGQPIYHYRPLREKLTGRVRIRHMYQNELGSLLPSKNYMSFKWFVDCMLIIFTFPVTLPVMLLTALIIKLESPGPALFIQERIGLGGKPFPVYKFRSMQHKVETVSTTHGDKRITRVGKIIRKTRIDELPQFFNVLKGEMSLIGPRAEYIGFANEFYKTVPFFNYRHVVRPGISGWAQVTQGYATGSDETKLKLQYDFYYISHFSFSLDLLIFFRTLLTMITGHGAR